VNAAKALLARDLICRRRLMRSPHTRSAETISSSRLHIRVETSWRVEAAGSVAGDGLVLIRDIAATHGIDRALTKLEIGGGRSLVVAAPQRDAARQVKWLLHLHFNPA
jgi:hypothetical protein